MNSWNQFPFVRILIPFVIGVYVAILTGCPMFWLTYVFGFLVLIYVLTVLFVYRRIAYRNRWVSGPLVFIVLLFFGYQWAILKSVSVPDRPINFAGPDYFLVQLSDDPVQKQNSYQVEAKLLAQAGNQDSLYYSGQALIYFEKDTLVDDLHYGDQLMIYTTIQKVTNPGNPGEFDYRRFLKLKGIVVQAYVKTSHWQKMGSGSGNIVVSRSKRIRRYFLEVLKSSGIKGDELSVASAILLGFDDYLDPDQKRQFSGAGAMHILCVSGLHVGIIALVLSYVLRFLNQNRHSRLLKMVILIFSIWMYAAITGLSPSVMRAATMFSFISIGNSFRRRISIYNMLAVSAFLLLLLDPFMLMAVGFQLSFLAVSGILLLYKPIYGILVFDHYLPDKIWQITVVSLSATLATFPLSLYYFNQFPNLFLVTNLIAIPASFLIVFLGTVLIAFSFIPLLSRLLGVILSWLLKGLNFSVELIEGLSFSTSKGINISYVEMLLLMLLITFFAVYLILGKKQSLYLGLSCVILLILSLGHKKFLYLQQQQIVVYNIRGFDAVEFIYGEQSIFLCDSALLEFPERISYATAGNRLHHGIRQTRFFDFKSDSLQEDWIWKKGAFISFAAYEIVLLSKGNDFLRGATPFHCNLLLVFDDPKFPLEDLEKTIHFDKMILGSSLPPWERKAWTEHIVKWPEKIHDISVRGAYAYEFH